MTRYLSPLTGQPLSADSPHSLSDGEGERWPVVDGIAYLRVGSEALAAAALAALDRGHRVAALELLLAENDRWWDAPPPPIADLTFLIKQQSTLSLRSAMALLGYDRVGTYFAHRWSDPTFVAGLALMDAHWTAPATAFELACGIGHYLRALDGAGVACTGADIVFSKLWIARHWVVGERADLVCFDADAAWPIALIADFACCHDAFYFLQQKPRVAAALRAIAPDGVVLVSHIHNRDWPNLSSGAAMTLAELEALFGDAVIYDDQVLTRAGVDGTTPKSGGELARVEAFALACGTGIDAPRAACGPLSRPADGRVLRRNPLCRNGAARWPSSRYAEEYGPRATYTCDITMPNEVTMAPQWAAAAARRDYVDLPERW